MTQMQRVSGRSTAIVTYGEETQVYYHSTPVVTFTPDRVTLRSGGWQSYTTKARMVQTAHQFDLGYTVYQRDFTWYVVLRKRYNWDWDNPILFYSGITFARTPDGLTLLSDN